MSKVIKCEGLDEQTKVLGKIQDTTNAVWEYGGEKPLDFIPFNDVRPHPVEHNPKKVNGSHCFKCYISIHNPHSPKEAKLQKTVDNMVIHWSSMDSIWEEQSITATEYMKER